MMYVIPQKHSSLLYFLLFIYLFANMTYKSKNLNEMSDKVNARRTSKISIMV